MNTRRIFIALLLSALLSSSVHAQTFTWIECEKPASANFPFEAQGSGEPTLLSEGKWLHKALSKEELPQQMPAEGFVLRYDVRVPEAGTYQVWARVGFEWVRPPIEWRIGDGAWTRVWTETRTTSLMRLALWSEAAWIPLGQATLPAGATTLQLRYREPGSDGRMIIALDCLALTKGKFVPEGKLKPGESYNREEDRAAAAHVFKVPQQNNTRVELSLNGQWQVARYDDPDMDAAPYEPVKSLPSPDEYPLRWMSAHVPLADERPELVFGHRRLYRARVDVPVTLRRRSFILHFSGTNWIVSVFVNGQFIGAHKGVLVPWDIDITRGIKAGQVNEIIVAVKGVAYARDAKAQNTTLEKSRNLPGESLQWSRWVAPIYPSTKGEGDGTKSGIVNPVTLIVAGSAYVSDVFVRPSVAKKRLDADVTVTNTTDVPLPLTLRCEAVHDRTKQVEHSFPPVEATVGAGASKTVTVGGEWANPKLWFPVDDPDLYTLRTTVVESGQTLDVHNQLFGFREITMDGIHVRINGIIRNFWNWVGVSGDPATPEEWLKRFRAEGNRFYRIAHDAETRKWLPCREAQLEFYDRSGVPGRLSTCVDGMFITYDLRNPLVWENFDEHVQQVARAYRNHPSVIVYSIENELLYINAQNIGHNMDEVEQKVFDIVQRAKAVDSTRPYMVDGGGALKGNRLEIDCPHYPEPPTDYYPDNAFTLAKIADHSSRWIWDRQRPMISGESFFYAGKLEDQAWIGGDSVFRGRDFANLGASKYTRLLVEGYRWQGVAGICPWVALERIPGAEKSFSDLAAFTRKRAHRFYAGRENSVLVKVFNDTFSANPVTFEWAITLDGKKVAGGAAQLSIEPGTGVEQTLRFTLPPAAKRQDGELLLRVSQNGVVGFEDDKPVTALTPVRLPIEAKSNSRSPSRLVGIEGRNSPNKFGTSVLVFDRSGKIEPTLRGWGFATIKVSALSELKGRSGLLLVGPDTLTAEEAYSTDILAFATRGGRAVVLEQEVPLAGVAMPAPVRSTPRFGGYAFAQALGTPIFANLKQGDFEDWAGNHPTYKRAYLKPTNGARSLMECGDGLNFSAMIEAPAGNGVIVAVQMRVGASLGIEPAADHLLANLLTYYSNYTPSKGVTAVLSPDGGKGFLALLPKAIAETGVHTENVSSLAQALTPGKYRVAVVPATAANLQALLQAQAQLTRFTDAGGWVMLWGLEPHGLATFNRLVGWNHQIRPFRLERLTLEKPEHPLCATLGNRDVTMYSPREIMHGDYWLSEHVMSDVVGSADAAPFCKMPEGPDDPFEFKPTFDDHDPYNYVNGMFNSDSWRYIRQIWIPQNGAQPLTFGFRQPATIRQINVWNNLNYWTIKDMDIIFDGDDAHPLRVVLPPHGGINEIKVEPPRRVEKSITLQIRSWRGDPIIRDGRELRLVGIDNAQFIQQLPAEYFQKVQVLDNVGGLVAYLRGKGGILLNQLRLMDNEPNPQNAGKKIRLVATLLQNMGASARSSAVVVPGVNADFTPIDITKYANRHIKPRDGQAGWFGDRNRDLGHLTVGQQFLADVLYHVSDYVNAPVPQAIMLGGPAPQTEVKGIAINRKADALYFLHAANVTQPVRDNERRRRDFKLPELLQYVVHYADGSTVEVPVLLEENVDHWLQPTPRPLPNARIAWSIPFPNSPSDAPRPMLYSMTWNNPKPEVAIVSVDVVRGKDGHRAAVAVLAVTVGRRMGATE
jgi:beta-galactosidase